MFTAPANHHRVFATAKANASAHIVSALEAADDLPTFTARCRNGARVMWEVTATACLRRPIAMKYQGGFVVLSDAREGCLEGRPASNHACESKK
jgi:hypothetical protein